MNSGVDQYLEIGCGRCPLVGTPDCKVNFWRSELIALRDIILKSGLKEGIKWSNPCYTFDGKNILMLSALKNHALIGFFKGSLINDTHGILVSPGKNSQADRRLVYTDVVTVLDQEPIILEYIQQAVEVEKAGLKVEYKKEPEPLPEELILVFEEEPELKLAFQKLTPGRQRGYILHFSQPKQPKTRFSRIEKAIPKIIMGKGINEF